MFHFNVNKLFFVEPSFLELSCFSGERNFKSCGILCRKGISDRGHDTSAEAPFASEDADLDEVGGTRLG